MDSYRSQAGGAHLYNKLFSSETGAILVETTQKQQPLFPTDVLYSICSRNPENTGVSWLFSEYGPEQNVQWPGYEGMGNNLQNVLINANQTPLMAQK